MHGKLTPDQLLRLLGFPEGGNNVEPHQVLGSNFHLYPIRAAKIAVVLANEFRPDHIDVVAGLGYSSAVLALFVAQSLSVRSNESSVSRQAEIAVVPIRYDCLGEGLDIERHEAGLLIGKRVLLVGSYASRSMNIRRISDFCREHGAREVLLGLVANFGCSPDQLGVKLVRSVVSF